MEDNKVKMSLCSEWNYKSEDLNVIETHDGLDISFRAEVISDLLKCPICSGFFRSATTIRECLHTFCKYCIVNSIEKEGPNCPKCNGFIGIRPLEELVYDITIQNITDKIFPYFKEREILLYEEFIGKYGTRAEIEEKNSELRLLRETSRKIVNRVEINGTQDIEHLPVDSTKHFYNKVLYPELSSQGESSIQERSCVSNLTMKIKLAPLPLSSNNDNHCNFILDKPYILVAPQMTVGHIQKYLVYKLREKIKKLPYIFLSGVRLPRNHSIEFICKSRRIPLDESLVLEYQILE